MKSKVKLEISDNGYTTIFSITFLDTGEIRQKVFPREALLKRIFTSELKSWKEKRNEELELE